ncbi:hypothetical protein GCM10011614_07590 [Novosphingobium colocasiae]|uniref:PilZ domain-containing protein n=2 Tax=Novosphingobium colocasiae TaxID=1256513 RepID=A0A918PB82_9SPHN|nr:hypothetical protein GCM10011614_07590 [Novosphingobium colocasiae]
MPLMRFQSEIDDDPFERRRETRHNSAVTVMLQFASGSRTSVQLTDVSLHGCCIRGDSDRLHQGRILSIGLNDHPMLDAIVRWVRDDTAGMEFLHPVPVERREWHDLMDSGFGL